MPDSYDYCAAQLDREHPPFTCRRRRGHNTVCGHIKDRGDTRYADAWAEYFAAHQEILADWEHQNGYWPPGHIEEIETDDKDSGWT